MPPTNSTAKTTKAKTTPGKSIQGKSTSGKTSGTKTRTKTQKKAAPAKNTRRQPKVICIFNQAGGQGKTTLCFNLGHHLTKRSRKVLLIDMDGQASLTKQADLKVKELKATVSDSLLKDEPLPVQSISYGMDIIPANGTMYTLDIQLATTVNVPGLRLREALATIQETYDVVLIDCPPSLSLPSINALMASTHILIPIECNDKGMEGIDSLIGAVQHVVQSGHKNLGFVGVVPVKAQRNQVKTKETLEEIHRYFGDFTTVFTAIPQRTDFEHAWGAHAPLELCNPSSDVLPIFEEITDHIERL